MTSIKLDDPSQTGIPAKDRPSAAASGAWKPVRQALQDGPKAPAITVSDPKEADAVASALRDACAGNDWLLSLAAADPERLLRAAGITLRGGGRQQFNRRRQSEGWGDRPEEFDGVASRPLGSSVAARPVLAPASTARTVGTPAAGSASVATAVERIQALSNYTLTTHSLGGGSSQVTPVISPTEEGRSHAADVNYPGIMGPWDAVLQLHESFLKRQYDVLFAVQAIAGIFGGGPDVIDFRFTFESWLFLFIRVDLVIDVLDEPGEVTLDGAGDDEVGVRFRFTATSYSRWSPNADWDQTDRFTGTFTRYGTLVKQTPITLAGATYRRTWSADLANGWTAIDLDDGPDGGREAILEPAVNAYFAAELPLLPATPTFPVDKPLLTYPTSAGFAHFTEPDLGAVSLCFHEDADSLISSYPFRHYILDRGRNLAIGISIKALEQDVVGGLDLPITEGSVTVETVTITGGFGRLHVRSEGKGPLGVKFSHTADILLSLDGGQLVAEVDDSTLNLPWWLWVLNTLLFVPLFGVGGLIPLAITNVIGSNIVGNKLEGLIDLSALEDAANLDTDVSGLTTTIERVEVSPFGVFLKGDIEIDSSQLL